MIIINFNNKKNSKMKRVFLMMAAVAIFLRRITAALHLLSLIPYFTEMKSVKFLFFALLIPLFAAAQTERVTDAPAWFFNPPAGEYAGVSMPFENFELARQHAVYAALLSYVAQNEVLIEFAESSEGYRNNDDFSSIQFNRCLFNLPGNYNIVKTAVNQHGEVFVSLQVMSDDSNNANITIVAELYTKGLNKEGFSEMHEKLKYEIDETQKLPNEMKGNVWYSEYTLNGATLIETNIERVTQRSSAKETFVPEQKYSYRPTANRILVDTKTGRLEPAWWSMYPVEHSLGAAYSSALLRGIIQESAFMAWTISSGIQKTASFDIEEKTDLEKNMETAARTVHVKVNKPARVITPKIDNEGNLCL